MIGCAYLRVFQPLETFSAEERTRLDSLQGAGSLRRPVYRHFGPARGRMGLLESVAERTEVREEGERRFVCPPRTRIRILAAMLSLRETVAPEVAEALVPEAEARRAARELAAMRKRDPRAVPTMLESPWHVPVRWFVLFEDAERRMNEGAEGGYRITYWTPLRLARRRAQRAAGILRRGDLEPISDMVRDMDQWLSCFDPASRVELDYGGAAASSGWNDLDEDHSAADIQQALDALERGELERAGELYRTVAGRWAEAKIRESLN